MTGTSGCTFFSQQATLNHYDASDGVSANVGNVGARNMIALISADGSVVNLLVTFVNTGTTIANVNIQFTSGGTKTTIVKSVRPRDSSSFGNAAGEPQILIQQPDTQAGSLLPVYLQVGTDPGQQVLVPVLNGSLPQYSTLVPTPAPTATSSK